MPKGSVWLLLFLLAGLGYVLALAVSYGSNARLVPLVIGVPTTLLAIYAIAGEQFFPRLMRRFDVRLLSREEGSEEEASGPGQEWRMVVTVMGWMAVFFVGVFYLGFLVTVPVATLLFLRFFARAGWVFSFVFSVVFSGAVWGFFRNFPELELFEGMVRGGFVPPL